MSRRLASRALGVAGMLLIGSGLAMGLALTDDPPDAVSVNGFIKIITYENRRTGEALRVMRRNASGLAYANVAGSQFAMTTADGAIVDVTESYVRPNVTITRFAQVSWWIALFAASVLIFLMVLVLFVHLDYDDFLLARQSRKVTCPRCGYDWRATQRRHCPECGLGHSLDPLISLMSGGKP